MRLTPHGQREMIIGTVICFALAVGLSFVHPALALLVLPLVIWLFAFFRDPDRDITPNAKAMVSPADGLVSDITQLDACDLVGGGPAMRIGIFLSVFNVHVNRAPCDGTVAAVTYKKGKFINAMSHATASADNESNTIVVYEPETQKIVAAIKQIVGLIARRIICTVKPGDSIIRGQRIGMIKFGSRTELYIPASLNPVVQVKVGDKVQGALTILATVDNPINLPPPMEAAPAKPNFKQQRERAEPLPLD